MHAVKDFVEKFEEPTNVGLAVGYYGSCERPCVAMVADSGLRYSVTAGGQTMQREVTIGGGSRVLTGSLREARA